MTEQFPASFQSLGIWAQEHVRTLAEARQRFAQMVILIGLAETAVLQRSLVFKGGNALDFVWSPNRSTIDLDFSLDTVTLDFDLSAAALSTLIANALLVVEPRFGMSMHLHGVRQHPPGPNRSFATLEARIGYALPDEFALRRRMEAGQRSTQVVPVEISLNEAICAATYIPIGVSGAVLRVATVEDIVAEKLRALLQQPARNRHRSQDVLDLAIILSDRPDLDPVTIGYFLDTKCRARNIRATREAFLDATIADYARSEYGELAVTTHRPMPSFDEAFSRILTFVGVLDIPDR